MKLGVIIILLKFELMISLIRMPVYRVLQGMTGGCTISCTILFLNLDVTVQNR